jgi:hypothetical protein
MSNAPGKRPNPWCNRRKTIRTHYEFKSHRSVETSGAGVSFLGPADSRTGNLFLHGLRVAVAAADHLDTEGRVLAKLPASTPNYPGDENRAASGSPNAVTDGYQNGSLANGQ